jgi:hypothetical protein
VLRGGGVPELLVEPPHPYVHGEPVRILAPAHLRLGAAAAASTLALSTTGDAVLLAALLGIAAGGIVSAAVAASAALAFALRWGATSLGAIAGAQAILGPSGVVEPAAGAAAAWCAAGALLLVSPADWRAAAFGLAAGLGVAGPAVVTGEDLAVRVAAAGTGIALAVLAGRFVPPAVSRPAALTLVGAAAVLALVA